MLKIVMPIAAALLAAMLFGVIYPMVRPDQARNPDDAIGYWIGTLLIPGVLLAAYALATVIEKRRVQQD